MKIAARQTWILSRKNLRIILQRNTLATLFRALVLPAAFMIFLSYAKNLLIPPVTYGLGSPHQIRSLQSGVDAATGDRKNLVWVSSYRGGQIDQVISAVSSQVTGMNILRYNDSSALTTTCRSTLRGVTSCYAAIVFTSSPTEGGTRWNYTIRADGNLGPGSLNVDSSTNDHEVYLLPVQHAVDHAIASLDPNITQALLSTPVNEFVYTSISNTQKNTEIREQFENLLINFMAAVLLIAMVGSVYHSASFLSEERESGLSTLLEAMMPNTARWVPQVCRLLSYWISFTLLYLPGLIIGSVAFSIGLFPNTNKAITILFHLLAGCALNSWAILGGVFFKKAQLSGITVTLVSLILGIVAQVLHDRVRYAAIPYVLGLLFAPCNYVFFILTVARFETQDEGTDLIRHAPFSWKIAPVVFWVFLVIQTFGYLVLAFYAERWIHGTASKGRQLVVGEEAEDRDPIELQSFTKIYPLTLFQRLFGFWFKKSPVVAVSGVSFSAVKGQILVLLGANGAGKSTTLDAVAGLGTVTSGTIRVNGEGGIGICPQRNVLWPELTVEEHVEIWNHLKAPTNPDGKVTRRELITAVDLDRKINSRAKTLSGGQKRKLQLACMLTGGSAVCAVDEVSSGLDPLSRRKIWDILMARRGERTIIMTTHFLDESDVLADKIVLMSKGTMRVQGSAAELKEKHGGGYRVTISDDENDGKIQGAMQLLAGIAVETAFRETSFKATDSTQVAQIVRVFEKIGITQYQLSEPTIETVFLNVAEEIRNEIRGETTRADSPSTDSASALEKAPGVSIAVAINDAEDLQLFPGRRISLFGQMKVLFRKRFVLFCRNWLPYVVAFLMPIFVAAIATHGLVKGQSPPGCNPGSQTSSKRVNTIANQHFYNLTLGPSESFPQRNASLYLAELLQGYNVTLKSFFAVPNASIVDSVGQFNQLVGANYKATTPGAIYAGDATSGPLIGYMGDLNIFDSMFTQNVLNNKLFGTNIVANYQSFDLPFNPNTGNSLQLVVYVCLVFSAYAAFFGLYTCLERVRGVRLLEYSNGARSLSRWLAYLLFDSIIILISSAVTIGLLVGLSSVWYGPGYLFLCIFLFGISSTLLGYCISLYTVSQLATFAFIAGYLAITFLIYIICYLCMLTYAQPDKIDESLIIVNFTVSLITPMGSLVRALFLSLNLFSSACDGTQFHTSPGNIEAFGGPILYLICQSCILFGFLLWYDSKFSFDSFKKAKPYLDMSALEDGISSEEAAEELSRVRNSHEGLRVLGVSKSFDRVTAVDNVTFGIHKDEIFGLLGPNGAGKSTMQSLIRGDLQPARGEGEIYVNNIRLRTHRAQARESLGVCPQLDSMDEMTVLEHLTHYAKMRGLTSEEMKHNVQAVLKAVGLETFSNRMGAKLSGGNKRRLMLGISILGNPAVLLLDEPSSGMDVVGQRAMWKSLLAISKGRAILLTTHSMEESSALASRVGIMAKRMLALGTIDHLRKAHGNLFNIHIVSKTAPHSSDEEMEQLRRWILAHFPNAKVDSKTYHGQMRFNVPADQPVEMKRSSVGTEDEIVEGEPDLIAGQHGGIGGIIALLEEQRENVGIAAFSVSPTTLDTVFLNIVQKHNIEEEGYKEEEKKRSCLPFKRQV